MRSHCGCIFLPRDSLYRREKSPGHKIKLTSEKFCTGIGALLRVDSLDNTSYSLISLSVTLGLGPKKIICSLVGSSLYNFLN